MITNIGDTPFDFEPGPYSLAKESSLVSYANRQTFQGVGQFTMVAAAKEYEFVHTFGVLNACRIRKIQCSGLFKKTATGDILDCGNSISIQVPAGVSFMPAPPIRSSGAASGWAGTVILYSGAGSYIDVDYNADDSFVLNPGVTYTVYSDMFADFAIGDILYIRFQIQVEYL
jgi:hypothetical protein